MTIEFAKRLGDVAEKLDSIQNCLIAIDYFEVSVWDAYINDDACICGFRSDFSYYEIPFRELEYIDVATNAFMRESGYDADKDAKLRGAADILLSPFLTD